MISHSAPHSSFNGQSIHWCVSFTLTTIQNHALACSIWPKDTDKNKLIDDNFPDLNDMNKPNHVIYSLCKLLTKNREAYKNLAHKEVLASHRGYYTNDH